MAKIIVSFSESRVGRLDPEDLSSIDNALLSVRALGTLYFFKFLNRREKIISGASVSSSWGDQEQARRVF